MLNKYEAEHFVVQETKRCENIDPTGKLQVRILTSVIHVSENRFARRAKAKFGDQWRLRVKRRKY